MHKRFDYWGMLEGGWNFIERSINKMVNPKNREIQYEMRIRVEEERKAGLNEINKLLKDLQGFKLSKRLKDALGVSDISELSADQLRELSQTVMSEGNIPTTSTDQGQLSKDEVKQIFTEALKEVVGSGVFSRSESDPGPDVADDRPKIKEVVIDPSENVGLDSKINFSAAETKTESVKDKLERLRKIKKGEING